MKTMYDDLLFVHESNLNNKIKTNYKGHKEELQTFMNSYYYPTREQLFGIVFDENQKPDLHEKEPKPTSIAQTNFDKAANIINSYFNKLSETSKQLNITSQSKFESTFYEEISMYLFKDLPAIQSKELSIYNKGIYAGLKIDNKYQISVIKKDVDFCIGKKVHVSIDNHDPLTLIVPVVAVEVKTYMDATMFGEIKSSGKAIRSASPNSKVFVLMGHKELADEHIIAARQDSTINEIFVLRKNSISPINSDALKAYYDSVCDAVNSIGIIDHIVTPGKILFP